MDTEKLNTEDYTDPQCPFCTDQYAKEPPVHSVPMGRIIEKLDEHLSRNDYTSAERHLLYWLDEAAEGRDKRGMLAITNELMGLYRKTGRRDDALRCVNEALHIVDELEIGNTVGAGTTYVNSATVYKAFSMTEKAMPIFEKALDIYERELKDNDSRLGSLYNNMALALMDTKKYAEANAYYNKAVSVMQKIENGELEQAITYLNMANCIELEKGSENAEKEIAVLIEDAFKLLDTPTVPRNGYYAFVCEKCASTFGYYGYFMYEIELKERAKRIYERD